MSELNRGEGLLTDGEAVQFIRTELFLGETGRPITQPELYKRGRAWADRLQITAKIFFSVVDGDEYPGRKVSDLENNKKRCTPFDLELIALAFDLPQKFFTGGPFTRATLTEAFHAARQAPLGSAADGGHAPKPVSAVAGFLRLDERNHGLARKSRLAAGIIHALEAARPHSSVVLVEGRTWAGKSVFTGYWFRDHYWPRYRGHALNLNCDALSIETVLEKVAAHFGPLAQEAGLELDAYFQTSSTPKLIVLDRLKMEHFAEGPPTLAGQRPTLRDLVRAMTPFVNAGRNVTLVLVIENNGPRVEDFAFSRTLDHSVGLHRVVLEPLDDEEGAELLAELGVTGLPEHTRREISRRNHGLPLAIRACADELMRLTALEQEDYVDDRVGGAIGGIGAADAFSRFFAEYVEPLATVGADTGTATDADEPAEAALGEANPLALLRLLSLMPGPLQIEDLRDLLDARQIARLETMRIESVLRGDIPFVRVDELSVHLQDRVARILRAELELAIRTDQLDPFCSREELEWIHWRCAMQNWRLIRNLPMDGEVDDLSINAIEAFVHHAMALIRLIGANDARRSQRFPSTVPANLIAQFEKGPGALTSAQLWMFACQRVVRPFLLENSYTKVRMFGQYETKARIIGYLLKEAEANVPAPMQERVELFKEMAVCLMHAGRLNSALRAIGRASTALAEIQPSSRARSAPLASTANWRLQCSVTAITLAINERLGRPAHQLEASAETVVNAALKVLDAEPPEPIPPDDEPPPAGAGAVRVLSRRAAVLLLQGKTEEALELFERTNRLQHKIRRHGLDGDAARKFAVALVRSREADPSRFERARDLIEENLTLYERKSNALGRCIDNTPFLLLRAIMLRVAGDVPSADRALVAAETHDFVRTGKATYLCLAELELERCRLEIARGRQTSKTFDRATDLAERLRDTNHLMLQNEALVVAAEAANAEDRTRLLNIAKTFFRRGDWLMRTADIAEIERGGSAVLRFGV